MAVISGTAALVAVISLIAAGGSYATYQGATTSSARSKSEDLQNNLKKLSGSNSNKEFEAYLRDNMFIGNIDSNTYKNALASYTKLRNNDYNFKELTKAEANSLSTLYNQLYENNSDFKSLWDKKYTSMPDEDKLAFLRGAGSSGATIPAPAYLDTSFDRYQKEVEPLKHYTNQELADLYNIDYNFDNIKRDYDNAAEAQVNYANWLSNLSANNAERNNTTDATSYLDAIRNIKSQAIQQGMSNGARAAADVLANTELIKNKVSNNTDVATQRFETMNDALLNRAQTELTTLDYYNNLAKSLSSAGNTLYANDVNRIGQDMLSNANFLSADENLRSNRQAQNNLMSSIYNSVSAQNLSANAAANRAYNYFKDISMPANDNDVNKALSDYIGLAYAQNTGYSDPMAKWGSAVNR